MKLKIKLTEKAQIELIETCFREYQNQDTYAPELPDNLMASLSVMATGYRQARNKWIVAGERARRATVDYQTSLKWLETRLRHAFQLVRRQMAMPDFSQTMVMAYGLRADGSFPLALRKLKNPVQIARDLIEADRQGVVRAESVLTDPTPSELESLIRRVEELEMANSVAQAEFQQERDQLLEVRDRAKALIKGIRNYLRFAMLDFSETARKETYRALGFSFQISSPNAATTGASSDGNTEDNTADEPDIANETEAASDQDATPSTQAA